MGARAKQRCTHAKISALPLPLELPSRVRFNPPPHRRLGLGRGRLWARGAAEDGGGGGARGAAHHCGACGAGFDPDLIRVESIRFRADSGPIEGRLRGDEFSGARVSDPTTQLQGLAPVRFAAGFGAAGLGEGARETEAVPGRRAGAAALDLVPVADCIGRVSGRMSQWASQRASASGRAGA